MAQNPIVMDKVDEVLKSVKGMTKKSVYVGIPDSADARTDTQMTNALIGYLMEHGVPERNVPARPFLVPGVKLVQDKTIEALNRAAQYALDGETDKVNKQLIAMGMRAVSSVQSYMRAGIPPPLAASTVRSRLNRTKAGKSRARRMKSQGVDFAAWGSSNLRPLIDTQQLLKSITFVIREK